MADAHSLETLLNRAKVEACELEDELNRLSISEANHRVDAAEQESTIKSLSAEIQELLTEKAVVEDTQIIDSLRRDIATVTKSRDHYMRIHEELSREYDRLATVAANRGADIKDLTGQIKELRESTTFKCEVTKYIKEE